MLPRRLLLVATAFAVLGCVAVAVGYAEYRTSTIARFLGDYLADINESRPSTGRLWELITSEREARSVLPDSISSSDEIPSDLPALVRNHRLRLERIPEVGTPGYLAILVEAIPIAEQDIVDTRRLVDGSRVHKLGQGILEKAALDAAPFMREARRQAAEMARQLGSPDLWPGESDEPAPRAEPEDESNLRTPEERLRTLPPDTISASVIETFTSVILEARLDRLKTRILTEWDDGQIEQLFLNRGLGAYEGELYYSDQTRPRVTFRISTDGVLTILGLPTAETTP